METPTTPGIFVSNMGLGDIILLVPAIVDCASKCTELYVFCKEIYSTSITPFFSNYKNIVFIYIPNSKNTFEEELYIYNTINELLTKYQNATIFKSGYYHNTPHPLIDFPINFYKDLKINYKDAIKTYVCPTTQKAEELYTILKNTGKQYIFLHTQSSNYSFDLEFDTNNTDILFINPEKNLYINSHPYYEIANKFLRVAEGLTTIDYKLLIENASEIHLIDSSYFCFAAQLNSIALIRVVYSRYNGYFKTLTNDKWQHLFIDTTSTE